MTTGGAAGGHPGEGRPSPPQAWPPHPGHHKDIASTSWPFPAVSRGIADDLTGLSETMLRAIRRIT
jgi:hypothetical protein